MTYPPLPRTNEAADADAPVSASAGPGGRARTVTTTFTAPVARAEAEPAHVALVGMPGSGKTAAGVLLAERLGTAFVDLDALIAQAAGRSLPALFQEQGEVMFRARERAQLRDVLRQAEPMVLACGGGTWADAAMRRELLLHTRPVLLRAPMEVLLSRLSAHGERSQRPLLAGPDPKAALERLWRAREPLHDACPRIVDASLRPPGEVADAIAQALAEPVDAARLQNALALEVPDATAAPARPRGEQPVLTQEAIPSFASFAVPPVAIPDAPTGLALASPSTLAEVAPVAAAAHATDALPPAARTLARPGHPPHAPTPDAVQSVPRATPSEPAPAAAFGPPTTVFLADEVEAFAPAPQGDVGRPLAPGPIIAGSAPLLRIKSEWGDYPIYLFNDGCQSVAEGIDAHNHGSHIAIVSDTEVAARHGDALAHALRARGLEVSVHLFAAGEESKRLATVHHLYDELADAGHGREDTLVALGGGVVTDLTGFLASTYMRGVPLVQVPTSTLAAVDACIGGKTGLNTRRGKNLIGTFFAPKAVLISATYLKTQSLRAHVAGLVEAVKVAALQDEPLLVCMREQADALAASESTLLAEVIGQALAHKARIVEEDERERGRRALLNYGHTLGHAIEVGEGFACLHGEAVALGMLAEATWAEVNGHAQGVVAPLLATLQALGVPTDWRAAKVDLDALGRDKKRMGDTLRLPILARIGSGHVVPVALDELIDFAQATMQPSTRRRA